MDFKDIVVEEIDILKTMEMLNERMRDSVSKKLTEEQMKSYDIGVKNTMNCLESLITDQEDGEKNRLIYQKYQKYGEEVCVYKKLSDVLKELETEKTEKIRIESDGQTAVIYLNGEHIKSPLLDFSFHGDAENGIHIKWDGIMQKLNENGMPYVENDKIATEEFHYDSNEAVVD